MSKTAVTQWDVVSANNTDVGGIAIQGTSPISNFDNAMREIMGQIATFITGATFTGTTTLGITNISSTAAGGSFLTLTNVEAGATGPDIVVFKDSASPAANDVIGRQLFNGRDSGNNITAYGLMRYGINDPTNGSEDGYIDWWTVKAGTLSVTATMALGLYMSGATGGDQGTGTINATNYYLNGVVFPTLTQATAAQYRANTAGLVLTTDKVWSAAAEVSLTDAATITVDMSTFINAVVTLGGNRILGSPTNEKNGQSGCIRIAQDATGSRTLTYGSEWKFAGGTAPTLSTAPGAQDFLFYYVYASGFIYANLIKAVA